MLVGTHQWTAEADDLTCKLRQRASCAKCADVSSLAPPNFVKSEPELYRTMPNTTINSLKKKNDKLKDEITALRKSFGELQQLLQRHDESPPNNGGHICSLNAETSTNLEFYGKVSILLIIQNKTNFVLRANLSLHYLL